MNKHLIVFTPSIALPEFEHITIFKEDSGFWHMLDLMANGNIDIRVVSGELVERISRRGRVVEIYKSANHPWRTGTIVSISCVSLAKLYLGIRESAVLTPDELYRYLKGERIGLMQKLLCPFRWVWLYFTV